MFVAAPIPEAVLERLDDRLAPLRTAFPTAAWSRPATMHLTVLFLGQTKASLVSGLGDELEVLARTTSPFAAHLAGSGAFGGGRRPLVAWLGLDRDGADGVIALAVAVRRAAQSAGILLPPDPGGRVQPHLTVCRRAPAELPERLAALVREGQPFAWLVDRLCLVRSHLEPSGARYEQLLLWPFAGASAHRQGGTIGQEEAADGTIGRDRRREAHAAGDDG